ncbi:MAG: SCO family protein, partial [Bryobacteraceae bacterium]|nr:SCO family protein [Bryobacteraceae bacterium]
PRLRESMVSKRSNPVLLALGLSAALWAADKPIPTQLKGIEVQEKLGQTIDLDLEFIDETGYPKTLRSYFASGRPVILDLVYYRCPMLCNLVLNGQTQTLRSSDWTPGKEYEIVTISIDPTEQFNLAQKKKAATLATFGREAPGWHFLTDYRGNVKKLAAQIGFGYRFDEQQQQYAHSAVVMVLTPQGKVSRYLYGILKPEKMRDVRFALVEAAQERFGLSERVLLWCFHYDPAARGYVVFARNLMKLGGGFIALLMIGLLARMWFKEDRSAFEAPAGKDWVTVK